MSATIVFPDHFEVRGAKGNLLKMTRLFRFRYYEPNNSELQDYVAAMESKHEPFLNNPTYIDVFRIDFTGAPLWVPLDCEDVYGVARRLYDNYQSAGFFIGEYRRRLCKKYNAKELLPYMEELEIKLLTEENPREIALSLLCELNNKRKVLADLKKAMCSVDKSDDMRKAADTLVLTLLGDIDGLLIGTKLFYEVNSKDILLNALCEMILMDSGDRFRMCNCVREYIYRNFWEKPCRLEYVRSVLEEYFCKATVIRELLDQYEKVGNSYNVKKEDIQALYLDPEWRSKWNEYRRELFK